MLLTKQKRNLLTVMVIFLAAFIPGISRACHLAAADIFIEYAGKKVDVCNPVPDYTYRVTFVTYSYCNCGLTTGATETLFYQSVNDGGAALSIALPRVARDTVDQLCPSFSLINQCRVPGNAQYPGYHRLTYSGIITLPSGQTDWKFWWSSSARNPSVNLLGQGSLYIEAGMDVLTKFDNNTPRFLSNPLPYICAGQPYNYLNLPYDPDSWDSNKVNVITTAPLIAAATTVTYAPGYSILNPINGYSLVNETGTATFTPLLTGQYTLSFRANDKTSYVLRDVQIAALPCTAPSPYMDTVAQNLNNATLLGVPRKDNKDWIDSVVYVCPGSKFTFDVNGWSDSLTHNLYMRSDISKFPGAVINTAAGAGTNKVTTTFTWEPTTADYGLHQLVITTVDSTCDPKQPVLLITNAVFLIKVVPGIDAGPDLSICELNPQPVQLFVKGTDNLRLKWSVVGGGPVIGLTQLAVHNPLIQYPYIQGSDTIFYPRNTGYIVSTVDLTGTCKAVDTVFVLLDTTNTVKITPKNPVNPDDALVMCRPQYLQLEALIKGRRPLNNVSCGIGNPVLCNKPDTIQLFGSPVYGQASYDTAGYSSPVMYTHVRTAKKEFLITKDELWEWGLRSATIRGLSFEMTGYKTTTHTYNNLTVSFKCTDDKELSGTRGFSNFGMTVVYSGSPTFGDGWQDLKFGTPYNWDTTKNLIIQLCYSGSEVLPCDTLNPVPVMKFSSTSYVASLMYKPLDTNTQSVCGVDKDPEMVAAKLRPVFRFLSCESEPLPFDIKWKDGEFLSDSTVAQPLAYVAKSDRYIVQTVGRSTCMMRDTLEVYVPEHDFSVVPEDTSFCLGDKAPFTVNGGYYFKWYEYINGQYVLPASVVNPGKSKTFISPTKTTEYRIVVSDSVFCYDTLSAKIKVLPLPDVRILNEDDTVIKYGHSFQLLASGARLYNWNNVNTLNNPNISYPMARPTEDTRYIVGGIATNGCRAFDTLHVIVDKRDNLFVPSAFSPNGDGKNDVFRVTNLSFQRILEFRVFNRWGQEVYSTNDIRAGWDGNYAGVPQEMGNYTYLIRVAYPDGYVETYKGETTLIR